MPVSSHPAVKDVVLIGAGHAHVQVLRRFGMETLPGLRLTLITREVQTPYSGMLPGLVAGRYSLDETHIDAGPLTRFAGARLYQSEVTGIDTAARRVICSNRPPVPYDVLSIDTGSTPNTAAVPGAHEHAIPVKPIGRFLGRVKGLLERVGEGGRRKIAMVGGGAAGVELILSLEARLRREAVAAGRDPGDLSYVLVAATPDILPKFPAAFRRRFRNILEARRIDVVTGARVTSVEPGALHIEGRAPLRTDEILWATEANAPEWLKATGLPLDADGFLEVGATLQVEGYNDIFAGGDVIAFTPRPLPKSGVYAVRTGPVLAENIRRAATGKALTRYQPQQEALYLISTGEGEAVGTRNGAVFSGEWVWRWKDRIDRRFMDRFNALPEMASGKGADAAPAAAAETSVAAAHDGPAALLSRVLPDLDRLTRPEVVAGLAAPDNIAVIDTGGEHLTVQSIEHFGAFLEDPYLFGKIAANHALGGLYALGAEPRTALAIVALPPGSEAKMEADLRAMLTGANETLREAGCALTGCQASEAAEPALGFSVNGVAPRDRLSRGSAANTGDVLILTKPLGTGTLLAAHRRGSAKASWLMEAVGHMAQSNAAAARILQAHGATAAAHVAGLGVLGHLMQMARAGGVEAWLGLSNLPLLPGVRETLAMRDLSSPPPGNAWLGRAIANRDAVDGLPLYSMLFDPQTGGGLLASIPAAKAAACLADLRAAGYAQAASIGLVREKSNAAAPITVLAGDVETQAG
jgi:selenide, water dikinase